MSSLAWPTVVLSVLSSFVALTAAWLGARVQRGTMERTLRAQFEENERVRREQQAEADKVREFEWLQERRKLMHDEKRRAYGEFMAVAGAYPAVRSQRDEAAKLAERRERKLEDEIRWGRLARDDPSHADWHRAYQDRLNATEEILRDATRKLELVLADLQLIAPENVIIAAENVTDLLYEGKPFKEQIATFIRVARQDLGAD